MPRYAWWLVGGTWTAFMVIFALTSFPNHYNFRTSATELGYGLQVMYYYRHGRLIPPPITIIYNDTPVEPHVSPSLILALPFYWIGGAWGLLAHQWLMVGLMAAGMFMYGRHRTGSWQTGFWVMFHFLGMWGLISIFGWDWHDVVSIAWIPWFLYALESKKPIMFFISWLLFIGGKENFALWGVWMGLLLIIPYRRSDQRRWLLWGAVISIVWFVLSYFLYKGGEGSSSRLDLYRYLASHDPIGVLQGRESEPEFSFSRIIRTILFRPQLIWTLLFESPYPEAYTFGIKSELHWSVLWSGGWSFAFQPLFLIMLLPVYLYKLLAIDYQLWGTLNHYSVEFAALLPIAVLWTAERWRGSWKFWGALVGGALGAHIMNISLLDHRYSKWYDPARHRWYKCEHYKSPQGYNYQKIHEGLRIIPREAAVSATSRLAPHIPARYEYYHFPSIKRAEYIALLRNDPNPWPLSPTQLNQYIESLERSPDWEKVWDRDQLVIFRRRSAPKAP